MREVNLSGVDLNLLPVLDALLRRRNVTRAAEDVGLSQPAMSRALGRLREVLGDELLVRARGGLVLTPRAQALAPRLTATLAELKGLYAEPAFDPGRANRTLTLAATDLHTTLLLPRIMARLAVEAPGLSLRVESIGPDIVERVESGAVDLTFAVGHQPLPPGAATEVFARDRLSLVMRRNHPAANRAWQVEDYAAFDHVGIRLMGDSQSEVDALLAARGVARRMAVVTPHFSAALATVAVTDLVTTLSHAYARRFADLYELRLVQTPFGATDFDLSMVWSLARSADPVMTWLRSVVKDVAAEVY